MINETVSKLKKVIRKNKMLYDIYYFIGSCTLNVLKYLIPCDSSLILFSSYSGKKYDDSPKAIYEQMLRDERFSKMKLVWAFEEIEGFDYLKHKVSINSLGYIISALRARFWITNVGIERGLSFKGRKTFYINTWHGSPIKKIGQDILFGKNVFKTNVKKWDVDVLLSQSNYEKNISSRVFGVPKHKIEVIGLPRNDELVAKNTVDEVVRLKGKLDIPLEKKVIFYAPTFREYEMDNNDDFVLLPPIKWEKWEKTLSDTYIILFRAHSAVMKVMNVRQNDFLRDVSHYPYLNDLLLVSDILISDYSSIYFDYSILKRPMLCFCYDYEEYARTRGMYFDIREELDSDNRTEEELLESIKRLDVGKAKNIAESFNRKYVEVAGESSVKVLDIVYDELNKK